MKPRDPQARSRQALQEAVDRSAREQARSAARGPEPWPGDLYVMAETAGLPVEWLVVERAASGRCRLVAADTHPALGGADVAVPAASEGGPLSVRCAVGLEVGVEILRRGERTGTVAPEALAAVRRHLEHHLKTTAAGSPGPEPDPDPELEDWRAEVLAPARAALLPAGLRDEPASPRRAGLRMALAAILLLLAALGGVSALAWRIHRGELQARREVERLVGERRAPSPAPLVNLAYASFYPGETRGTTRTPKDIAIPGAATHLLLVFYVGHREPCADYELEVSRSGAPVAPITVRGLRPLPGKEVSVALPRAQVPAGLYQLRLYGLCGTERRALGDYGARLQASP